MYVVYEQKWEHGQTSVHRSPMDIGEFAKNCNPEPVRVGQYKEVRQKNDKLIKSLEGKLGWWK